MDVEIWSDIACPWCYVGKRRLEKAIDGVPGFVVNGVFLFSGAAEPQVMVEAFRRVGAGRGFLASSEKP